MRPHGEARVKSDGVLRAVERTPASSLSEWGGLEEKSSEVSLTLGRHPSSWVENRLGWSEGKGGPVRNPSQGSWEETMVPECGGGGEW